MKLSKTTMTLIIALIASLGVAGIVLFNATRAPSDEEILSEGQPVGDAEIVFLNLASQIESIRFDSSIFEDPRFRALEDIRVAVIPEEKGRRDPFAALIGISVAP